VVRVCPVLEVLHENGFVVTVSDTGERPVIQYLRNLGIRVDATHEAKNVEGLIFRLFSAVKMDNPE
jgi:UDP-N-acetylmuramate--alanine ligase